MTTSYPYNDIVYITDTIGGVSYQASGILISPDEVLTAAHVVYTTGIGTATNIKVSPGYNGGVTQGSYSGSGIHYYTVQDAGDVESLSSSQYDFAVIHLTTPVLTSQPVTLTANYAGGTVNVTGYPATSHGLLWTMSESVYVNASYSILEGSGTSPGASGGPVWYTDSSGVAHIVGLVSTGNTQTGVSNFAQITSTTLAQIGAWAAADDAAATYTVANATGMYQIGWLNFAAHVVDSAANVQASLGSLQSMAAAGDLASIVWNSSITPLMTLSVATVDADFAALRTIASSTIIDETGTSGNDVFYSLPGGATFVTGNGGHDAVNFRGASSGYTLSSLQGTLRVTDGTSGRDGTTFATGVNYVVFTDQTVVVATADQANIARLYEAAFARQPDLPGLNFWEDTYASQIAAGGDRTAGLVSVAAAFSGANEFQSLYPNTSNLAFVDLLYHNALGRSADTAGEAYWTNALNSGVETRAMVLVGFAESPESISRTAGWLVTV